MLPFYRTLLRLYPAAYRCEFGDEMLEVFSEVQGEIRKKGAMTQVFFAMREAGGLFSGALHEHLRSITGSYDNGIFSARRFAMKSQFRFPKATVGLMIMILAVVMLAIEKARVISMSIPHTNPPLSPTQSMQEAIVPAFLAALVSITEAMCVAVVAGAIGWGILYALRRTGVQQLSEMNPSPGPKPR